MTNSISNYNTSSGDAIGLNKIDGQAFTLVDVEDNPYRSTEEVKVRNADGTETTEQQEKVTPGVLITTKESFEVEGVEYSKFYTTRKAVVDMLSNEALRADLKSGKEIDPVKCEKIPSKKGGKPYYTLVDANS